MSRTFVVAATIVALSVLSPSALLGQQAPPPAAHHGPLPKPVNLKVLPKDTSPEDLIKIMRGFTQQLGVHCNFCHSEGATPGHMDFASDTKPEKNTARTMMLMSHEINEKYMSQIHDPDAAPDQRTVRCSTCHQGHSMPVTFTPPEHPPAPPKP
ncbi:MAG TPA: c-type cytochrome [Acidobacteriaceae bacterium]|nr:c-type cytochrome [Acidobacteriaceae bacterium]